MTRVPSLALAAATLTGAAVVLAGLLWLAPSVAEGGRGPADPDATGSVLQGSAPADGVVLVPVEDASAAPATEPVAVEAAVVPEADTADVPVASTQEVVAAPARPLFFVASRDAQAVRLTGAVPDESLRAAFFEAARARFTTEPVIDDMAVLPEAEATPPEAAAAALSALARLAEGEAKLAGGAVELSGRALYRQAEARIRDELSERLPDGWDARLALTTPDPIPEPIIAPIPSRSASPAPTAKAVASAEAEPRVTATATVDAAPPRPQRSALAGLEGHPLPPRR